MANRTIKGIRFYRGQNQSASPAIEEHVIISNYNTAVYEGFPVLKVDDGSVEVCAAATATIYGVVVSCNQYYNANLSRVIKPLGISPKFIPASTVYTGVERESRVSVIPVVGNLFVMDADAALATATRAGARALIGSNGDHVISTDDCALDISDVETNDASAASAQWSIVDVIEEYDTDFTASRVKFIVKCNEPQFIAGGVGL